MYAPSACPFLLAFGGRETCVWAVIRLADAPSAPAPLLERVAELQGLALRIGSCSGVYHAALPLHVLATKFELPFPGYRPLACQETVPADTEKRQLKTLYSLGRRFFPLLAVCPSTLLDVYCPLVVLYCCLVRAELHASMQLSAHTSNIFSICCAKS
jgi:hypothetical protein